MTYKSYIHFLLFAFVLQLSACKKDDTKEPEKHLVAGNYVNLGVTTNYKLLGMMTSYLDGGSDSYRFSYNDLGMVDTILFSNISKGRGVGFNEIHKYYYVEYDNKNWPSKITMTSFDPQGKPTYYLVKYNEEKGTITDLTNESGIVKRSFEYDGGDNVVKLIIRDMQYVSEAIINYSYEGRNIKSSKQGNDTLNEVYQYVLHDEKKTYISAIHGLDNVLALSLFNCTDLYNNTIKWENYTTNGQQTSYHYVGTCLYQYNGDGLPITKQERINGVEQTTTYSYTQ